MKRKFVLWGILVILFLYPFIGLFLHWALGWNVGKLYTFDLELKDFLTVWIALGGVAGVVANFFLSRRRMEAQQEQFDEQIGKQNEQIKLQQKQQRDARFAAGVELLGNPHESTRIGGAYSLYFLARDHGEYRTAVCEILCAHLRTIANKDKFETDDNGRPKNYPKNEVQSVIDLLFGKFENGVSIFLEEKKDLNGIFLFGVSFRRQDGKYFPTLNKVNFRKATLTEVVFVGATLTEVDFEEATLTDVDLGGAKLTIVNFREATLTKVNFWETTLTGVSFFVATLTEIKFFAATLIEVDFIGATLTEVDFFVATLTTVDFEKATLTKVDFNDTPLERYSYEEITKRGRSLKLTAPKEEKPE